MRANSRWRFISCCNKHSWHRHQIAAVKRPLHLCTATCKLMSLSLRSNSSKQCLRSKLQAAWLTRSNFRHRAASFQLPPCVKCQEQRWANRIPKWNLADHGNNRHFDHSRIPRCFLRSWIYYMLPQASLLGAYQDADRRPSSGASCSSREGRCSGHRLRTRRRRDEHLGKAKETRIKGSKWLIRSP